MATEQLVETVGEARRAKGPSGGALAASDLVKRYGKRRVVDGVGLHVEPGEVVGLLGPNGAGKTTTFYMIIGLERPDGGRITLAGRDITKLPMYLRARLGVGYLPQEPALDRQHPECVGERDPAGLGRDRRDLGPRALRSCKDPPLSPLHVEVGQL